MDIIISIVIICKVYLPIYTIIVANVISLSFRMTTIITYICTYSSVFVF